MRSRVYKDSEQVFFLSVRDQPPALEQLRAQSFGYWVENDAIEKFAVKFW